MDSIFSLAFNIQIFMVSTVKMHFQKLQKLLFFLLVNKKISHQQRIIFILRPHGEQRRWSLEKLIVFGKTEGIRMLGRAPTRWTDHVKYKFYTVIRNALDRNRRRQITRSQSKPKANHDQTWGNNYIYIHREREFKKCLPDTIFQSFLKPLLTTYYPVVRYPHKILTFNRYLRPCPGISLNLLIVPRSNTAYNSHLVSKEKLVPKVFTGE